MNFRFQRKFSIKPEARCHTNKAIYNPPPQSRTVGRSGIEKTAHFLFWLRTDRLTDRRTRKVLESGVRYLKAIEHRYLSKQQGQPRAGHK